MVKIEQLVDQRTNRQEITTQAVVYKGETYRYFDQGLTRYVFVNEKRTKVIKFLIDPEMKDFNAEEYEIYKKASAEHKENMAATSIGMGGTLVEQEFCNPIKHDGRKMSIPQMLFAKSCRNEVGWTKDGKLVCFDLDEYKKW